MLQAVTAQQPLEVGRQAVDAAIALIDGKAVEASVTVPVLGLNRADKAGVDKFLEDLKQMM